jgi:post-segregation antitoxin (ccd killing protein)
MLTADAPKTRRLNVMISEPLIEWVTRTAEAREITISALVREALERECERSENEAIAEAAEALAPLYASDENLKAFTALDGEQFA